MKNSDGSRHPRSLFIVCLALIAFAASTLLWHTRQAAARPSMSTSVNINNNSSREIRNVYESHVGADDWSSNLLGNSTIASGQSASVNVACDVQQMKVIAEDSDGCFASYVIACGGNSSWTITNDTARDCGGQQP